MRDAQKGAMSSVFSIETATCTLLNTFDLRDFAHRTAEIRPT